MNNPDEIEIEEVEVDVDPSNKLSDLRSQFDDLTPSPGDSINCSIVFQKFKLMCEMLNCAKKLDIREFATGKESDVTLVIANEMFQFIYDYFDIFQRYDHWNILVKVMYNRSMGMMDEVMSVRRYENSMRRAQCMRAMSNVAVKTQTYMIANNMFHLVNGETA